MTLTSHAVTEKRFWDLFESTEVNSLSGVPATFEILKQMRFERMPLTNLRTLTQAGGRLNAKTVEHFAGLAAKSGWRFYVMYGQTEATARMSFLSPDLVQSNPSSIGKAIPGGRFEIVSEDHDVVNRPGIAGQLVYYGPNVMLGYAESVEDLRRGDDLNGRLPTGDLAEQDEQGLFYITGRMNRFIKLLGLRYNLDEIEAQLQSDGYNVVVVGCEDRILVAGAKVVDLEAAACRMCESTGLRRAVVSTISVAEIPRSSSGKVQYAELLRLDAMNHHVSA
jgi:acyl-coenzyme A synthetase/AMP-(fatty) acid ligase